VNHLLIDEENMQLLTEMGFTKTQAEIYLILLRLGETDVRTLSNKADKPNPEVYRTLNELQRKGLVEKELSAPSKFTATPLQFGLQMLIIQKERQFKETQKRMKEFLRKNQSCPIKTSIEKRKIIVLEGKGKLMQKMKNEHNNVQRTVDIITTLQRWLQILDFCFQDYLEALDRKVEYRVVIPKPAGEITFPESIQVLLDKPSFELRLREEPIKINAAVFDENEATINFFEGKSLMESPIIWTNHPAFIQMCEDHFDKVWKSAVHFER
jgi:sugar-specific transcriptional regulator TrmB